MWLGLRPGAKPLLRLKRAGLSAVTGARRGALLGGMKITPLFFLLAGLGLANALPAKPHIRILATGGTIAGVQAVAGQADYKPGVLTVEALLASAPGTAELADVSAEQVANIGSNDMTDAVWLRLVRRVEAALADPTVDGVVVTHGTDTMEESAWLLELTTGGPKPVVLVGSMRPATALSADGPANLRNAVGLAADPAARNRGVMVALNETIHAARDVTKVHGMRVDAFASPNRGPLGWVKEGRAHFYTPPAGERGAARLPWGEAVTLPRVDIVYSHAGADRVLLDAAVVAGAKGIVVAGSGAGSLTREMRRAAREIVTGGVTLVRTARHSAGMVDRQEVGEDSDAALGTVAGGDLTAPKARVVLKLLLAQPRTVAEVQAFFDAL